MAFISLSMRIIAKDIAGVLEQSRYRDAEQPLQTWYKVTVMDIRPIKTENDYEAALQEIACLMDAKLQHAGRRPPGYPGDLVEAYEAKHYPIAGPTGYRDSGSYWKRCR